MPTENARLQRITTRRDAKAKDHLQQYAPVWLADEKLILDEDALQFNVVFYHPQYGWVNRRYRYDEFTDVLYHKGQRIIDEEEALQYQENEPYVKAPIINTVDSYGG